MHASPNRRTTLRVVNLPTEIDSESRPTIRHRPLPSRAPGAFSPKAIVTVAWGFSTPGPIAAPHPPHIFPMFCRRRRRVFAEGDCYRMVTIQVPWPRPVPRAFPRCFAAAASAFSPKAIVNVAWGFLTPGPMAASRPPRISSMFCRRPRRVFAEGDCYRSLGFLYPRTRGRVTPPAHFPDVLPPQAAKHRGVPFAHVGRFPVRSVRCGVRDCLAEIV